MSDAPRIRDDFLANNKEQDSSLKWERTSPDVPEAKIKATFDLAGLSYAQRARYLVEIRQALSGLPGWGGGDY